MNNRVILISLFTIITGLFSCKNKDLPTPAGAVSYITLVNAADDTVNFYENGTRLNQLSSVYSGGVSGYIQANAGEQVLSFKKRRRADVLFTLPYNLIGGSYYSIFFCAENNDNTFVIADDLQGSANLIASDTTHESATIRLANCSPTQSINVTATGTSDTLSFNGVAYKTVSPFTLLKAGNVDVKVFDADGTVALIDTTFAVPANSTNTIFVMGKNNGKGTAALQIKFWNNGNNQ